MSQQESLSTLIDDFDRESGRRGKGKPVGGGGQAAWVKPLVAAFAVLVAVAALALLAARTVGGTSGAVMSRTRLLKDSESGEVFKQYRLRDGDTLPAVNPKTGKRTLYPVEFCYWTEDGEGKTEPTYVILNEALGKEAPTTCPDCGREVVFHNPEPPVDVMMEAFRRERGGG